MRYTSSSEAVARAIEMEFSFKTLGVTRLSVHLDGCDFVPVINPDDIDAGGEPAVELHEQSKLTQLMRYFRRPLGPDFDTLTFTEYFARYNVSEAATQNQITTYDRGGRVPVVDSRVNTYSVDRGNVDNPLAKPFRVSKRNQNPGHVSRIFYVFPSAGEVYFLRKLLLAAPFASFADAHTFRLHTF